MDDIVFELRRKSKGLIYTYGDLYYDGKVLAKTLELNWVERDDKSPIKAQVYNIIWLGGIFDRRIYLEQVDDEGCSFITVRGSVLIGKEYRNGHIGIGNKALRKVHECYRDWLKKHPTWGNGKINIIDDFDNG